MRRGPLRTPFLIEPRMATSILIVDSQRERIRSLQKALERLQEHFILTGVLSGEEGLLEARLNRVDLIISRTNLPGMNGVSLLKNIRSVRPNAKAILLGNPADHADSGPVHPDILLAEPISEDAFLQAVIELLDLKPLETGPAPTESQAALPKDPHIRISDRLTRLRLDLEAEAVILINDSGQVLARAGSLPEHDIEPAVLPALMAAFSAGARISRFLGPTDQPNQYFYRGEKIHLVMSAVGHSWALVSATRVELTSRRAAAIHAAVPDIAGALLKLGVPTLPEEQAQVPPFVTELDEVAGETAESLDTRLEALLDEMPVANREDVDAFWEPRGEFYIQDGLAPDSLTYEQAVQLGLAPEDDH